MNLAELLEELQRIADHTDPKAVEVQVQGWDDNMYDGSKVEGIRLVNERDYEKNEFHTTLFFVY